MSFIILIVIICIILGMLRLFISVGDEYYIPTNKKTSNMNGLTKFGKILYKLKGVTDDRKVRVLHPIGLIVFILMMIASIPICLFKEVTIFDILNEFTLI